MIYNIQGHPFWFSSKESTCNAEDMGLIPGSGRSPGGGYSNPLQYSCLENPTDRGAWQAVVHRVVQSDMTEATKQHQVTKVVTLVTLKLRTQSRLKRQGIAEIPVQPF